MWPPDLRPAPRRILLAAGLIAGACLAASAGPAPGQTAGPMGHVESGATGQIVESAEAMKVTSQILCYCGGCANQTLHDCTCGLAAQERGKVAAAIASGRSPEELIAAYIAEHGPQIRVVPERRGLNLIGWMVPFIAAAAALVTLLLILRGWVRRAAAAGALPAARDPQAAASERPYRDRLERDLKEMDA